MSDFDAFMDDIFHGCAFAAFVEEAAKVKAVPCSEATRRRAFRYFEEALAEKQGRTSANGPS
jgi:hypothetical protein